MAKSNSKAWAIAAVLIIVVAAFAGLVYTGKIDLTPKAPTQAYTPQPAFDYELTEVNAHIISDLSNDNGAIIYWEVSYNDTSDAFVSSTNVATLNFTLLRDDAVEGAAMAYCAIGNVVEVEGEPILAQTGNDYSAAWTKTGISTTFYGDCRVSVAEAGSAYATVVLTLDAAAFAELTIHQHVDLMLYIGGNSITVEIEKAIVST